MRIKSILLALLFWPAVAIAQQSILQGGATTQGHVPVFVTGGTGQPITIDGGPAGGNTTGQGLSELNITARGTACNTAAYPVVCVGQGTGIDGSIFQIQDAVSTNPAGYHALSFSANAGTGGLIEYSAQGGASTLPLNIKVNGTTIAFPFVLTGVVGPSSSVVNDVACWNNTAGTLLKDCGAFPSVGGTPNQIQYNAAGSFGGFTMSGDCTIVVATGVITCPKSSGVNISLGGALTTSSTFTTAGVFPLTLTTTAATNVTLPLTGTLSTLAGSEALTNKTYNGNTFTAGTGVLTIAAAKTATFSNTITIAGTDGSTLNIGGGGTLGSAAFTTAITGTQITNFLSGTVTLNNTAAYFDGPSVAQGSTGTWFCSGTVSFIDTGGSANFFVKLWDGTTVIASTATWTIGNVNVGTASLSGYLASPAGNIRISVRDNTATTGTIQFNASGASKDSGVTCYRVA
jgi:hypothetical protein